MISVKPTETSSDPAPTLGSEQRHFNNESLCSKNGSAVVWEIYTETMLGEGTALTLVFPMLIILGNMTVIIWRCLSKKEQRSSIPSMLVLNLATVDFFYGAALLLFHLLTSSLLCVAWLSPNTATLMISLCIATGVLYNTYVFVSPVIGATIAFYYVAVVYGGCCCIRKFSRRGVLVFLCVDWFIVLVIVTYFEIVTYDRLHPPFDAKTQEIYDTDAATNRLIPSNSTISLIVPENCLAIDVNEGLLLFVVILVCCFIVMTGVAYIAIVIRLCRLVALDKARNLSTKVGGLGFRLIATAVMTFLGWTAAAILYFIYNEGVVVPNILVALSNPLMFTLTSRPFLNALGRLKQKVCFKIGRPTPIEDVTNDRESLIATKAPPSETTETA